MRVLSILILALVFQSGLAQSGELKSFAVSLKNEHTSGDVALLKKAFRKSHKSYLRHYKAYSEVDDIFKSGNYDCLSGTLFFATLLDELGFKYKIYETNYHIFLIATTSNGEVLLETTDKINGFVKKKNEINNRVNDYRQRLEGTPSMYLAGLSIFNEVSRAQMEGLVFFNRAISSFLKHNLEPSYYFLKQAKGAYNTPRISEFAKVLLQQVAVSSADGRAKEMLISNIKSLMDERVSLASR